MQALRHWQSAVSDLMSWVFCQHREKKRQQLQLEHGVLVWWGGDKFVHPFTGKITKKAEVSVAPMGNKHTGLSQEDLVLPTNSFKPCKEAS